MKDTTPNTGQGNDLDELESELQRLANKAASKCPQVADAALALITAVNYEGETLVDSSFASLQVALAEVANGCVVRELSASAGTQEGLRQGWQRYIDKKAYELTVLDEIKDKIEWIIDERIARLLNLRKFVQSLEELGQQVEKAKALDEGIRELRKFREDLLGGWPSRRPPSPIDPDAVAKAREAIRRGDKGMSKRELIWGDKRSEKAV
jgi:hypothetical protein